MTTVDNTVYAVKIHSSQVAIKKAIKKQILNI